MCSSLHVVFLAPKLFYSVLHTAAGPSAPSQESLDTPGQDGNSQGMVDGHMTMPPISLAVDPTLILPSSTPSSPSQATEHVNQAGTPTSPPTQATDFGTDAPFDSLNLGTPRLVSTVPTACPLLDTPRAMHGSTVRGHNVAHNSLAFPARNHEAALSSITNGGGTVKGAGWAAESAPGSAAVRDLARAMSLASAAHLVRNNVDSCLE